MVEIVKFRGPNRITPEEAQIIYDLVLEEEPIKVLEIGTYAGYATIWIAKALQKIDESLVMTSVGNYTSLEPQPEQNLDNNLVPNVRIVKSANLLRRVEELLDETSFNFIFIDDDVFVVNEFG